jgi:hypothetical protein
MKTARLVVLLCALALPVVASGCVAAVAAGVAGVAYVRGEATKTYERNMDACTKAAEQVFVALAITKTTEKGDKFDYRMNGKTDNDTTVEVRFKAISDNTCQVGVRFGVFGDKTKSFLFFEELDKQMK